MIKTLRSETKTFFSSTQKAEAPVVATVSGKVAGTRKEAVDPRQNVTVAWTAYYVRIILTD